MNVRPTQSQKSAFLRIVSSLVAICAVVVGLAVHADEAPSLQDLDQSIRAAKNLDGFLASKPIQKKYLAALKRFYGHEFREDSYWEMIKQLKKLVIKIPALKRRLWETTNLGTEFSVFANLETSGRIIYQSEWKTFWDAHVQEIAGQQGPTANLDDAAFLLHLRSVVAGFNQRRKDIEATLIELPKRQSEIQMGQFYKQEAQNPEYQQIGARLLNEHLLMREDVRDLLTANDADTVLDAMEDIRKNLGDKIAIPKEIKPLPAPIVQFMRSQIPSRDELLQKKNIFPAETKVAKEYRFIPLPRRIHGLWGGIDIGECVAGGKEVSDITAERFLTSAIAGTQRYVMMTDRQLGFVQIVPIRHKKDGNIYGSVDFGAPLLARYLIDPTTNRTLQDTLFDLWFEKMQGQLPPNWQGLIVSNSEAINNAGVHAKVVKTIKYLLAPNLGSRDDFEVMDPIATKIADQSPRDTNLKEQYGGRMIFDGMVPTATEMHKLVNESMSLLNDKPRMMTALTTGPEDFRRALLSVTEEHNQLEDPDILKEIDRLANDGTLPEIQKKAVATIIANSGRNPNVMSMKIDLILTDKVNPAQRDAVLNELIRQKRFDRQVTQFLVDRMASPQSDLTGDRYLKKAPLTNEQIDQMERAVTTVPSLSRRFILDLEYDPKRKQENLLALTLQADDINVKILMAQQYFQTGVSHEEVAYIIREIVRAIALGKHDANFYISNRESLIKMQSELLSTEEALEVWREALQQVSTRTLSVQASYILIKLPITNDIIKTLLERTVHFDNSAIITLILEKVIRPEPEFIKFLYLKFLAEGDYGINFGTKAALIDYFSKDSPEEDAYLFDLVRWTLKTPESVVNQDNKAFEIRRVFEILAHLRRFVPDDIADICLGLMEQRTWLGSAGAGPEVWFKNINLTNPQIAIRVQKLYLEKKLNPRLEVIDFMNRFPVLIPEFSTLMRNFQKWTVQSGDYPALRKQVNRIIRRTPLCEVPLAGASAK